MIECRVNINKKRGFKMIKKQKYEIKKGYDKNVLSDILKNFEKSGILDAEVGRNKIKKFIIINNGEKKEINVKNFGKKNILSQLIYKYFTASKAKRSYEYANRLLEKNIKTPEPIAYFDDYIDEETKEKKSFYISEELNYEFTCREVFWDEKSSPEINLLLSKERDKIIREFTEFTFDLHEKGIKFEDFSPGNVLIKMEKNGKYGFYLVDLNRMKFNQKMNLSVRMKNVSKMIEFKKYAEKISEEYAKLCKKPYEKVFKKLYFYMTLHKYIVKFKDNTRDIREKFKFKKIK